MIYEIYVINNNDDKLVYYPNDEHYTIANAVLNQAMNEAGTLEFDVPALNPMYNELHERQSEIKVLKDGIEIFYGEIREVSTKMNFTKHVYAVGELAYLFDSIQPQRVYQNVTPLQMFRDLINIHNSQVEKKKQFTFYSISVTDANNNVYHFTNREDTLTAMRDKLCDTLKGYLKITKKNGIRYLSLVKLEDYGKNCDQDIEFGDNLLDYTAKESGTGIATAVIPLGSRLEEQEVKGLDAYTTITSSNKTPPDGIIHKAGTDYVYSVEGVRQFGWITVVKKWDDVTVPDNLLTKASNWLKTVQYADLEINLNAVDMKVLDVNFDSFELGDAISATATPLGMERTTFHIMKKKTYLQDFTRNYVSMGTSVKKSYTQQSSKAITDISNEIPQASQLLKDAKENAYNLLMSAEGGVIWYEFDEKGRRRAMVISDNEDAEKSTKGWIWNINGLGYGLKKNGQWQVPEVAITMDGHIVANAITTGYMSADRLKGGVLEVGGSGYARNGSIVVKNANNQDIITIDKEGIKLTNNMLIKWEYINAPDNLVKTDQIENFTTLEKAIEAVKKLDVTSLKDNYNKLWSTTIGNTWLATTTVVAQQLVSTLLYANDKAYINFGASSRPTLTDTKLKDWLHIKDGNNVVRIDSSARLSADRFIATDNGDADASTRIEYTGAGMKVVKGGSQYMLDAKQIHDLLIGTTNPTKQAKMMQLYAWAYENGFNPSL